MNTEHTQGDELNMDNRTVIKNVLRTGRRTGMFFLCLFLLFTSVFSGVSAAETYGRDHDARPSKDGPLKVDGTTLVNAQGDPAVLRGVSTHGLTWYPDYVNETLFDEISENWGANIVRLAMYSEDYLTDPQENLKILKRGIEAAVKADMYVLVDWHILNDANPLQNMDAKLLFKVNPFDERLDAMVGGAGSEFGTGGMATKLAAARLAAQAGIDTVVTNGAVPENLYTIIEHGGVGTLFTVKG